MTTKSDKAVETMKAIAEKSPFRAAVYVVSCPECGHKQPPGYTCASCNASIAHAAIVQAPTRHAAPSANQEQRPL